MATAGPAARPVPASGLKNGSPDISAIRRPGCLGNSCCWLNLAVVVACSARVKGSKGTLKHFGHDALKAKNAKVSAPAPSRWQGLAQTGAVDCNAGGHPNCREHKYKNVIPAPGKPLH